jgi:hypothetical protein
MQPVTFNEEYTVEAPATREYYTFDGWYVVEDGVVTDTEFVGGTWTTVGDVEVAAKWTFEEGEYSMKYNFNVTDALVTQITKAAYPGGSKVSFEYYIPEGTTPGWWGIAWNIDAEKANNYNAAGIYADGTPYSDYYKLSDATGTWMKAEFTLPEGNDYFLYFGSEMGAGAGNWLLGEGNSYALIDNFKVGEVKEDSYPKRAPVPMEFAVEPDSPSSKPWAWFKFLAQTDSGYILIETDAGLVTVNPYAARERIAFERLMKKHGEIAVQRLLIPETVQFTPPEFARISASLAEIEGMGFSIEKFGHDTFKVDAVPQLTLNLSPSAILSTISRDLGETQARRAGEKWREELIAKSIARSFAGSSVAMNEKTAVKLVEELCSCRMPYVCPRGKPVMIFTSTRELNRKFERD